MKINGNLEGVYKAYQPAKVEKKDVTDIKEDGGNKSDAVKDKVTISNDAKIESRKFEVDFIKRRMGDVSATREDKVADIKQKIQDGTYHIDLDKVAEAILNKVV